MAGEAQGGESRHPGTAAQVMLEIDGTRVPATAR